MFQVFGHKHRQRISEGKTNVRWSAGAVNPSRSERLFVPSYNIIELEVAGSGANRRIDVRSHLYSFQSNPEAFHPIRIDGGAEVFLHSIAFPAEAERVATTEVVALVGNEVAEAIVIEQVAVTVATDAEASMGDRRTRHLVDRFWDLDASDRREIALELGLITMEEIQLPEAQRYGVALIRASERNLLDQLERLVGERE
jgi:hypothetical protein